MQFNELALDDAILAGVAAAGFEECTEVQEQAIPHILSGKDVAVQSQTGTGKTAAFLLPIFHLMRHEEKFLDVQALVIAPTRELAHQIKDEADLLANDVSVTTAVFYGGVGYGPQIDALKRRPNILVGTPGRLIDLNQSGQLDFGNIGILVIDEADRLFDMGFYPDIRKMLKRMRDRRERLNMLFSATLSVKARNIAWEHMNDPIEIEIHPEQVTVERVKQTIYHVSSSEKMALLLGLLKKYQPKSALIFTNTKRAAEIVAKRMARNGYPTEFIVGDLPQKKRLSIINRIKAGETQFLVATDVAARGLHINNLDMVFNYDLPEDPEAYVHRIGRTARAGESGRAVTLACERFVYSLDAIENLIGQPIDAEKYDESLLETDVSAGERIATRDRGDGGRSSSGPRGAARRRGGRDGGHGGSSSHRPGPRPPRARKPAPADDKPAAVSSPAPKRADSHRPRPDRSVARSAPGRGDSIEDRIAYYRAKYGEDFRPTNEMLKNLPSDKRPQKRTQKNTAKKPKKPGLLGRLFGQRDT